MTGSHAHQDSGNSKSGKETPDALGAGTGLGPPAVVAESFWKTYCERVPEKAEVRASAMPVDPGQMRDALENPLLSKDFSSPAFLFFVDLKPEANWAYACAYVFVAETGETAWCDARWPPQELIWLCGCKSNRSRGGGGASSINLATVCRTVLDGRPGYIEEFVALNPPLLE